MLRSITPIRSTVYRKEQLEHDPPSNDIFDSLDPTDPVAERKLLWRLDLHILPPPIVLFWLSFLDRSNIGNAKIQGMIEGLHMEGQDYNIALSIFFILMCSSKSPAA
jgi:hypothetical protein